MMGLKRVSLDSYSPLFNLILLFIFTSTFIFSYSGKLASLIFLSTHTHTYWDWAFLESAARQAGT